MAGRGRVCGLGWVSPGLLAPRDAPGFQTALFCIEGGSQQGLSETSTWSKPGPPSVSAMRSGPLHAGQMLWG